VLPRTVSPERVIERWVLQALALLPTESLVPELLLTALQALASGLLKLAANYCIDRFRLFLDTIVRYTSGGCMQPPCGFPGSHAVVSIETHCKSSLS
jgi:hypothetical protein